MTNKQAINIAQTKKETLTKGRGDNGKKCTSTERKTGQICDDSINHMSPVRMSQAC